jgi:ParB-like chromosome segregation protein Spo0J
MRRDGGNPMTTKRAEVPVNSIIVDDEYDRHHDDAHIEMRAEIIARYGLLYPITVNKELRLLAGDQWLTAVKKLGWPTVEVLIVEAAS